jgi:dipeptidyl aminopeptidase/acylaminoacyl peptidase
MATDVAVEVMKRTIAIALLFTIAAVRAGGQEYRPMVVEDLFNLQAMTDVRMSPDGTSIAVVIQRAWSDPETYRPYAMFGNDHADVWILPAAGGPPRNITHGRKNGSGYWNLVWSPDGERLALLSTEGGDNIRAYVWEKRSGQLKRVADRGVDTRARTNAIGNENPLTRHRPARKGAALAFSCAPANAANRVGGVEEGRARTGTCDLWV